MYDNQRSGRRTRSGSRPRRRGGRNSSPSQSSSSRDYEGSRQERQPQAPPKLSFWQRLASLVGIKPKQAAPASRSRGTQAGTHRRFETAPAPQPQQQQRQARKPELVEVNSPKIYVGNLSFDATESDLTDLFNGVGKVQAAEIVSNKYTQKSKGFAFVTMMSVDEARRAVTELHDKEFMGRKLVVSGAKTNDAQPRYGSSSPQAETAAESEPAMP